jgi:long-chain fatty acid transport protein
MSRQRVLAVRGLATAALIAGAAGPAFSAGFGFFEQGTRAMGMAGAYTAQADDPSMLFHNPGGLAFVTDPALAGGLTYIQALEAEFEGADPFPGEGYTAEQEMLSEGLPHGYYVAPINETWKWGVALNAPFGLVTEWEDPDSFAGRYLSTKAALRVVDVAPTLGWRLTPRFGIGFAPVIRFSDVELERRIGQINPFTQRAVDVAALSLESDIDSGYGFNVGMLHHATDAFSWGLSYRSKVEVEYGGEARMSQVPSGSTQFDTLVRAALPFDTDLPVETAIEFPDMASLGFAFRFNPAMLVETDINWTGWSSFDEVPINFTGGPTNSLPDSTIPEHWDDAMNYRIGFRWTRPAREWRFGYVYDETPQPEEAVSPLLPDANRHGITVGYGKVAQEGFVWDVALMYLMFEERDRDESFNEEEPPFFGTYNTEAVLLGLTIGWN